MQTLQKVFSRWSIIAGKCVKIGEMYANDAQKQEKQMLKRKKCTQKCEKACNFS